MTNQPPRLTVVQSSPEADDAPTEADVSTLTAAHRMARTQPGYKPGEKNQPPIVAAGAITLRLGAAGVTRWGPKALDDITAQVVAVQASDRHGGATGERLCAMVASAVAANAPEVRQAAIRRIAATAALIEDEAIMTETLFDAHPPSIRPVRIPAPHLIPKLRAAGFDLEADYLAESQEAFQAAVTEEKRLQRVELARVLPIIAPTLRPGPPPAAG